MFWTRNGIGRYAGMMLCSLIVCSLFPAPGEAALRWARTFGASGEDRATSVRSTSDGGYILAGNTYSFGAGSYDAWCLKLDAAGNVAWQRAYGGAGYDWVAAVRQTADRGYILSGSTSSFGAGQSDAWCLKLDAAGNVAWQRTYGGPSFDAFWAIEQTADGGWILAGETTSFGAGNWDAWCLKLNASGNVVWNRTYGGPSFDQASDVQQTADGGYILTGSTSSFGAGSSDAWCLKLDAAGNVAWQRTYGGASEDYAGAVQQTADGGFILAGSADLFGGGEFDAWCLKLNPEGNVAWQRTYGGSAGDIAYGVQQTADGGYILTGSTESFGAGSGDAWCMKLDAHGDVAWQRTYGGASNDIAFEMQQTDDGGYILAGATNSFGTGSYDAWCLKIGPDGEIDPSCGTLVQSSSASTTASTAVPASSSASPANTSAVGIMSSAVTADTAATVTVLCGGGVPAPAITSIRSRTGKPGSNATIRGTGFSIDKKTNLVRFGERRAKSIKLATATMIKLKIPRKVKGTVEVYVVVNGEKSNGLPFTVK